MNRKLISVLTLIVAGFFFITVANLVAEDKKEPPKEITIENKGYKKDKKGPVKLLHEKHNKEHKVACAECHHDYDKEGNNKWKEGDAVKLCKDCHDPNKDQSKKCKKLNAAYHTNCKNCHKKLVEEGKSKDAPFKKCNKCHQGAAGADDEKEE